MVEDIKRLRVEDSLRVEDIQGCASKDIRRCASRVTSGVDLAKNIFLRSGDSDGFIRKM